MCCFVVACYLVFWCLVLLFISLFYTLLGNQPVYLNPCYLQTVSVEQSIEKGNNKSVVFQLQLVYYVPHHISWTGQQISTRSAWILYWDMMKSWFDFLDLDPFFKISAGFKLPNLSQKVLVCTITWTSWRILTRFAWIQHLDMVKSWIGFDVLDLIFKVTVRLNLCVCLHVISWIIGWNVTKFAK